MVKRYLELAAEPKQEQRLTEKTVEHVTAVSTAMIKIKKNKTIQKINK